MIVSEWQLSKEATWADFVRWWGIHAGEHSEEELATEAAAGGTPELRRIALAEIARRGALEAPC